MAFLFNEDLFRCKCNNVRFEEVEIKSFNKVSDKELQLYNSTKYLKCTECKKLYPLDVIGGHTIV